MKNILAIVAIALVATCAPAFAQGVVDFGIDFGVYPPPHTVGVSESGARLTDSLLYAAIYLSETQPASARILKMGEGGTLITIFDFPNPIFAAYAPPPGAVAYSFEQSWQLTPLQIDDLMAGEWYAEISYPESTYLGLITPVPEPSSFVLLACGLVVVVAGARRRSQGF